MITRTTKLAAVLLLGLAAIPSLAQTPPDLVDIPVTLTYDQASGKIVVTTPGNCATDNTVGCFETPKSAYTRLQFEIPAPASNNWFLKAIGICRGSTETYPPCGPLRKWERAEFIATKSGVDTMLHPDKDGLIELPGQTTNVDLFIMNNIAQDWWYSLQACKKNDPSTCTNIDPQIKNRGRN